MLLSVIIPVFNVEKYIKKCLLSVLDCGLSNDKYEIIVIDDETPDNSIKIVNELKSKYSHIKLKHQKNKGLGGARNTGILLSQGKYVLFLDSDDYLNSINLEIVLKKAIKNNLDILEFGAIKVLENKKEVYKFSKPTSKIFDGYAYLDKKQHIHSVCNKLYKLSFLRKYKLFFEDNIFTEDIEFNNRAFYYAKRVQRTNKILSFFVQTPNSITRNQNLGMNKKMVKDINQVINLSLNFSKKIELDKLKKKIIDRRIAFITIMLLYNIMKLSINKDLRNTIIIDLQNKNVFPVRTKVKDFRKNLFILIFNNVKLFNMFCDLKIKYYSRLSANS